MKQGLRTLSIISTNPDNFIKIETGQNITQMLRRNQIHIAAIQETHIPHSLNYISDGYRVITTASTRIQNEQPLGLTTGGVAILIHNELEQHITHITRINNRIMHLTLQSQNSHRPKAILNTYASHSGKGKKEQKDHWRQVKETLEIIPTRHIIIWCADANGQIGK